ncbi:MAG: hypothetical protein R2695_03080 [Acidimicrobiales bacterium]
MEEQPSLFQALSSTALGEGSDHADGDDVEGVRRRPPRRHRRGRGPDRRHGRPGRAGRGASAATTAPGSAASTRASLGDLRSRHARKKELRQWNSDRVVALVQATGMDHRSVNAELNRRAGVDAVGDAEETELRRRLSTADAWLESLRS